jgi:predicted nucleotide-binding protein (sugar kinase/HSP70/actin superfamily)
MVKLGYQKPIKKQTLDELYHSIDELSSMGLYDTRMDSIIKEIKRREKQMTSELKELTFN